MSPQISQEAQPSGNGSGLGFFVAFGAFLIRMWFLWMDHPAVNALAAIRNARAIHTKSGHVMLLVMFIDCSLEWLIVIVVFDVGEWFGFELVHRSIECSSEPSELMANGFHCFLVDDVTEYGLSVPIVSNLAVMGDGSKYVLDRLLGSNESILVPKFGFPCIAEFVQHVSPSWVFGFVFFQKSRIDKK